MKVSLAAVAATLLAVAGCGSSSSSTSGNTSPIQLGMIQPITSQSAIVAETGINGAKLAVNEINSSGGVNGRKINLTIEDDHGDATTGVNVFETLTTQVKADAVMGPNFSAIALATLPKVNQAKIPWLPAALAPQLTQQGSPWVFRIRPTTVAQAVGLADYVGKDLKPASFAVISSTDDYGTSGHDAIVKQLATYNMKPAIEQTFVVNSTDFTAQAKRIVDANVAVCVWFGFGESAAAKFVSQVRSLGFKGQLVGDNDYNDQTVINLVPKELEGAIGVTNFLPNNDVPRVKKFDDAYNKAYGKDPDGYAAAFYDAVNLLGQCWKQVGTDKAKVRECLHGIKNFQGVSITFNFASSNGDPGTSEVITQYSNGKLKVLKVTN